MKIGEFFEKHVQWIALGLAGVWLLWIGWAYGVNRPVIELNNQNFSAGAVDEYIRDTDASALATKVANPNVPAGLVDVPDFTDAFVNAMNGRESNPYPAFAFNSSPPYGEVINNQPTRREKVPVKQLPNVVTPTDVLTLAGRSQIIQPTEKPKILTAAVNNNSVNNAENANNGNGGSRVFSDNNSVQPQPQRAAVAAAAPLPGQPAGAQEDKTWVSIFARLNFSDQDKEFTKVSIPPYLLQKQYIEVQLQRQEVLVGGGLGTIETVRGLPMNEPPIARKNAADFIKWSADPDAQKMILTPPFYFVVKGTAWELPRKDVTAVAAAQDQPADFNLQQKYQEYKALKTDAEKRKFTDGWTNEQKQAFYTYRRGEEQKEGAAKAPPKAQPSRTYPNPRPGAGGAGGGAGRPGGNREGGFDAIDPQLLREMYADSDAVLNRQRNGKSPQEAPPYRRRETRKTYEGEAAAQPAQNQAQILVNLTPDAMGNVDIWAHDETAKPGLTYRYRVRVVIKNPLYDTKNVATDPKLAQIPYLPADPATGNLDPNAAWSDWSKPVAIPTNVDMMLVSAQTLAGREVARFRVKRFQEGQVNEAPRPFEVAPGDLIGGKERVPGATKEVDFTTSWTLVDIRQTGNGDYRVRIMDNEGRMEVRTVAGDRSRFKEESPKAGGAAAIGTVGSR